MGTLQPGYKPSLVMIFACLGDIHAERHQKTKRKADLDEAISATQLALSISSPDHPINATLLNNLANGIWQRYQSIRREDDLHQAISYVLQALDSISHDDSNRAAVLATLGAIRASFYECQGEYQNIQEAIALTRKSIDIIIRYEGAAPLELLNNLGAYLWTQYCLTSRREDLDQSVVTLLKALESQTDSTADRVSCLINCVQVLNRRYHRTGQLGDLSSALEIAQEAMRLDPGNADLATLLKHLDQFLDRRRGHQLQSRRSKGKLETSLGPWKLLLLLAALTTVIAMYHYHVRTEILLSVIAFPCGLMLRSTLNRASRSDRNATKNTFRSLTFMKELFGSRAGPQEYSPKLLAVPLIPVPFTSSLRGIQTSGVSAYSSLLHEQRRQSMHSVKPDRAVKRRPPAGPGRGRDTQVRKGRHHGHQPISSPHERHREMPTTTVATAPSILTRQESPRRHFSIALRTAIPQAEAGFSRNGGSMQESIHTDSGYGSYNNRHDRVVDEDCMDEDPDITSTNEQQQQLEPTNALSDSYSQPAISQNTRKTKHISSESPLVPSKNPWVESGDNYSEHRIWEEYTLPAKPEEEKVSARVITQGHTRLEMNKNSGLAMGNVTSRRAAIVGYVASMESQPRRQSSHHEISTTSPPEDSQRRTIFQEEEVHIASVKDIADSQDTASTDASVEDVEVQVEAPLPSVPLASIVDNLMRSEAPRIVEVEEDYDEESEEDADPEQSSDMDLVDQLAWEYLKQS